MTSYHFVNLKQLEVEHIET